MICDCRTSNIGDIISAASIFIAAASIIVFHILASRRQKRDEVLKFIDRFEEKLNDFRKECSFVWSKSGIEVQSGGLDYTLKNMLHDLNLDAEILISMNKGFSIVKVRISEVRRHSDECKINDVLVGLLDKDRGPYSSLPSDIIFSILKTKKSIRNAFKEIYY